MPQVDFAVSPLYQEILRALEGDVRAGRLRPGTRLPTHRDLSDHLGVARGTIMRAYAEAEQRGLVRSEVGRGTFVSGAEPPKPALLVGHRTPPETIDLGVNAPMYGEDPDPAAVLRGIAADPERGGLLRYHPPEGQERYRRAGAVWARMCGVDAGPERLLPCAGAQHAVLVALSGLARAGQTILVEEFLYPGVKDIANQLHLKVAPVAMDPEGLEPGALAAACRQRHGTVLYCTPTLQNPTSAVMSPGRRREVVRLAREHDLAILEDDVHRLYAPDCGETLAALAPERTFFVVSLSKCVAAGLRVAYLAVPAGLQDRFARVTWASVLNVPTLMLEVAARWIEDGTAVATLGRKKQEAARRQLLAREVLGTHRYDAHPASLMIWLHLPDGWRAGSFAAEARRRNVVVTPAEAFAAASTTTTEAVRVCLGAAPDAARLRTALETLRCILDGPERCPAIV